MICRNCGREMEDGNKFCTGCGAELVPDDEKENAAETVEEQDAEINEENLQEEDEQSRLGKKKKLMIGAVIAAVVLVFGTVIAYCNFLSPDAKYEKYLELGQKYLLEENYEEAIVAFKKAIKIDPKRAEAYEKIADAYVALGDEEKALEYLKKGYENTKDKGLKKYIDKLNKQIEEKKLEEEKERMKEAQELLAGIEYYGDRTKCKMSADMALAYATEIEKFEQKSMPSEMIERGYKKHALLADFADDGMPIIVLDYTSDMSEDEWDPFGRGVFNPIICGYSDSQIVKLNPNSISYLYTLKNGEETILAVADSSAGFRRFIPDFVWYYSISKGNIKLIKTLQQVEIYVNKSDEKIEWEYLDAQGNLSKKTSSQEELLNYGFCWDDDEKSFLLGIFVDGKSITQQVLNKNLFYIEAPGDGEGRKLILDGFEVDICILDECWREDGISLSIDTSPASDVADVLNKYCKILNGEQ